MVQQVAKKLVNKLIAYAFMAGVIIALVLGLVSARLSPGTVAVLTTVLILAGIVVGFFNITPDEAKDYVMYVTAIVIVTSLGGDILGKVQMVGPYLESVLGTILAFVLPSVVIVGIKAVINLAKD
jgi:hypothetical protein